ncbi:MAG TPA: hypothetical protein VLW54_14105 [Candidatus Acidoferrales bacterium]|nr:hypothetical protein [Candidatus Acidoferrales bacterium]
MRKLVLPILILGLAAVPAAWAAGGPGDGAPPAPAADKPAASTSANLPEAPKPAAAAAAPAAPAPAATPALESQLAELRALINAQAAEIEAQRRELAEMKAKIGSVKEEAVSAAVTASVPAATEAAVKAADPDNQEKGPNAWHFKGITFTPMGFFVAETVYRQRALDSDVNTAFTSIPFNASNEHNISEFNASGRQSRIAMLVQGKLASAKIGGYYEADFLSAGVTSNNRQSNSYTLRQRQFWAQAALDSGWTFTGGQMWSLVTETKKGMENRTEAAPMTIDAQYTAGFSWARQYAFRITKEFDKKWWLGFSVEDPQIVTATLHANGSAYVGNLVYQNTGNAGGLYNNSTSYTLNATPDFVFKAAFEPGWGHYEVVGLLRTFRSRFFPCIVPATVTAPTECTGVPTTSFATNDTKAGGGFAVNARAPFFDKHVDIGVHFLYGDGVGRYGTVGLPDVTARPTGQLALIHAGQALGTIEWHVNPKLDVYLNGGGDYAGRTFYTTVPQTATVSAVSFGYGSPFFNNSGCSSTIEVAPGVGTPNKAGSCTGDLRDVIEGTFGFWHKIYKGDKGTVQWGAQYSYVVINSWSGTNGTPVTGSAQFHPDGTENMFFTSFRYYIP